MRYLIERLETLIEAKGDITGAMVKRALKDEDFRLDADSRSMHRMTSKDVTPGVSVHEYRKQKISKGRNMPTGPSQYKATSYQGKDAPGGRWKSSDQTDLKSVVTWINQQREASERSYKTESKTPPQFLPEKPKRKPKPKRPESDKKTY